MNNETIEIEKKYCVGKSLEKEATLFSSSYNSLTVSHTPQLTQPYKDTPNQTEESVLSFSPRKQLNKPISISRTLFKKMAQDKALKRAIAFSITIKSYIYCGVASNFKYKQLAQLAGVSESTARRCINKLIETGYAKKIGKYEQHLQFLAVDKPYNNVKLKRKFDFTSFHNTMLGLNAASVIEAQQRKDYVVQQGLKLNDQASDMHQIRRACKVLKRQGLQSGKEFADNGISQDRICKENKISKSSLHQAILYAEHNDIYHRHKQYAVLMAFDSAYEAYGTLSTMKEDASETWVRNIFNGAARKMKKDYNRNKAKIYSLNIKKKAERAFVVFERTFAKYILAFQTAMTYETKETARERYVYANTVLCQRYALL